MNMFVKGEGVLYLLVLHAILLLQGLKLTLVTKI